MDKYYVYISGYGDTSRANVEALIEDYVYANGNDVVFVLVYESKPTAGQTFVSQWAKDKAKDVVIFAHPDAKYDGLSAATVNETNSPYEDSVAFLGKGDKAVGFILWNDDDPRSNQIVSVFNQHAIHCYDLTDGLNVINVQAVEEEAPVIPDAEKIEEEPEEIDELFEEEDWDEEEDEEEENLDDIYFGLQFLIKAIAREVAKELQKATKEAEA